MLKAQITERCTILHFHLCSCIFNGINIVLFMHGLRMILLNHYKTISTIYAFHIKFTRLQ